MCIFALNQTSTKMKDKTILFIAASPSNGTIIRWEREFKSLKRIFRNSNHLSNSFSLDLDPQASIDDLVESLRGNPWMVHFSGHGHLGTGDIYLCNTNNTAQLVSTNKFLKVLKYSKGLECILFASCSSNYLIDKTQMIVKYSIGFEDSIDNDKSLVFMEEFYKNIDLSEIESIDHAFQRTITNLDIKQQNNFQPILKSRKKFIMEEIIEKGRTDLLEELTPEGIGDLDLIKKQIEKANKGIDILIQKEENEFENMMSINSKLEFSKQKHLKEHTFKNEIQFFIENRERYASKFADVFFYLEEDDRKEYFVTELSIMFDFLESALLTQNYNEIDVNDLKFNTLEFDKKYYKEAFLKIDDLIKKEYPCSEDFLAYLRDNARYIQNLI
jgi:hypothetical protein